jgi:hypothetical protein
VVETAFLVGRTFGAEAHGLPTLGRHPPTREAAMAAFAAWAMIRAGL